MRKSGYGLGGEDILTAREVAVYLKVNRRTVYRLLKARKIPAFRIGGQWRFKRSELDRWLEAGKIKVDDDKEFPKV